jgi:hypothetical protein
MRRIDRTIDLGAIAPIRGTNIPAAGPALDLTRQEFSIPRAARPFIMPRKLIWRGLPSEETTITRLFNARSNVEEPWDGALGCGLANHTDSGLGGGDWWPPARYILRGLHSSKKWLPGSGLWGCQEWRGIMGLVEILDEWILIATDTTNLIARQIKERPSGAFPIQIRAVGDWSRSAIVTKSGAVERSGMGQRWPLEPYAISKALLTELKWARKTFGYLADVIKNYVDCSNPPYAVGTTPCREVVGYKDPATYEKYQATLTYMSGVGGKADLLGNVTYPAELADILEYAVEMIGLFEAYQGLQELVVSTINEVVIDLTKAISETGELIETFGDTISDAVPIIGMIIEVATWMVATKMEQDARDAAALRERGLPTLYRGTTVDGRPAVLSRSDIETWTLMMFRALKLQEVRVSALVDGTSALPGAMRTRPPGEARYPVVIGTHNRPLRPGAGAQKALSDGAKAALAVGSGASLAGLVWWLWKRYR